MEFIRKYIHVAKLVKPVLTQEASDYIAEEYSRLRSHDQVNSDSARVCITQITLISASYAIHLTVPAIKGKVFKASSNRTVIQIKADFQLFSPLPLVS